MGRDVEDIVKDLVEASVSLVRQKLRERMAAATAEKAEALILEARQGDNSTPFTRLSQIPISRPHSLIHPLSLVRRLSVSTPRRPSETPSRVFTGWVSWMIARSAST